MQYCTVGSPRHGKTSHRSRVTHTQGYVKTWNSKTLLPNHHGNHNKLLSFKQYGLESGNEEEIPWDIAPLHSEKTNREKRNEAPTKLSKNGGIGMKNKKLRGNIHKILSELAPMKTVIWRPIP